MGFFTKTANFVISYVVILAILYFVAPIFQPDTSAIEQDIANQVLSGGMTFEQATEYAEQELAKLPTPWLFYIISIIGYVALVAISFIRGRAVGKAWLIILPIVAALLGLFLAGLLVVSPLLHLATIIVGAWPSKQQGNMPMSNA